MTCRSAPIYTNLTSLKSPFPREVCPDARLQAQSCPSIPLASSRSLCSLPWVPAVYCFTRHVCLPLLELNPTPCVCCFLRLHGCLEHRTPPSTRRGKEFTQGPSPTTPCFSSSPTEWLFGKIILLWTLLLREVGRNRKQEWQATTGSCGEAWAFPLSGGV